MSFGISVFVSNRSTWKYPLFLHSSNSLKLRDQFSLNCVHWYLTWDPPHAKMQSYWPSTVALTLQQRWRCIRWTGKELGANPVRVFMSGDLGGKQSHAFPLKTGGDQLVSNVQGQSELLFLSFSVLFKVVSVKWTYIKEANFSAKMPQFVLRNSVWNTGLNDHS